MHARRVRQPAESGRADRHPPRPTNRASRRRPTSSERAAERGELVAADDLRRTIAAGASAVIPGFGQLINGRLRLARWFALPALILIAFLALRIATNSPARLLASIVSPSVMGLLLALNVVVLGWRLVSVLHAFFDRRYEARSGRAGAAGLALLLILVVVPHGLANALGSSSQAAFSSVFAGAGGSGPGGAVAAILGGLGSRDRVNLLIVGLDTAPGRAESLTDSLMVASVDPVGRTASLISVPGDIVRVPLGNGSLYGPKLNSLLSYADANPAQFPQGGMRALEDAVGALLGIRIDYYARLDLVGFARLVDAVGGVDVNVRKGFVDHRYDGLGINPKGIHGWSVTAGLHHFNGYEALAYARSRYASGESDFTRAVRQQELLVAIRARVMSDGGLLMRLPQLVTVFGGAVRTDLPADRLPDLAAVADQLKAASFFRLVLGAPYVRPGSDPALGSVLLADLPLIRAAVASIAPPAGETPVAPSAPQPTAAPVASMAPPVPTKAPAPTP